MQLVEVLDALAHARPGLSQIVRLHLFFHLVLSAAEESRPVGPLVCHVTTKPAATLALIVVLAVGAFEASEASKATTAASAAATTGSQNRLLIVEGILASIATTVAH